jgi:hypothetical protein
VGVYLSFIRYFLISEKLELKLKLIQTEVAQKQMLQAGVYACASRTNKNVKES